MDQMKFTGSSQLCSVINDVLIGQMLPLKLLEHFEITAVQNVADKNGDLDIEIHLDERNIPPSIYSKTDYESH